MSRRLYLTAGAVLMVWATACTKESAPERSALVSSPGIDGGTGGAGSSGGANSTGSGGAAIGGSSSGGTLSGSEANFGVATALASAPSCG